MPCGSTRRIPIHLAIPGQRRGACISASTAGLHWDHQNNQCVAIGQFLPGVAVDMSKPYWRVYGGLQEQRQVGRSPSHAQCGWHHRLQTGSAFCGNGWLPLPGRPDGIANIVYAEGQYGLFRRHWQRHHRGASNHSSAANGAGQGEYRFNWSSPILLSPHDPKVVYFGGNFLFRSPNRGDRWEIN